jgi:excisionase family DNA binding protein
MTATDTTTPGTDPARPLIWNLTDACRQLGVSKPRAYRLAREGKLRLLSDRGRTFVAESELQRYLASMTVLAPPPLPAPAAPADKDPDPPAPAVRRTRKATQARK